LEGAAHFAVMARAPIAAAKYGSKIFSNSICRITVSTVYSLTPRYFMSIPSKALGKHHHPLQRDV
jgi:hypothetical protein